MIILVKYRDKVLLVDRDYNFLLKSKINFDLDDEFFAHILSTNVAVVRVRNATENVVIIIKNMRVDNLQNFNEKDCYLINLENRHLVIVLFVSWIKRLKQVVVVELIMFVEFENFYVIEIEFSISQLDDNLNIKDNITKINTIETITHNEITIYDDGSIYNRLFTIVETYSNIWHESESAINVSKKNWMLILMILNVKSNGSKMYSLSSKDKKIVDKKFDRLYLEKKMS